MKETETWKLIQEYPFLDFRGNTQVHFVKKLASENDWTPEYTLRVIEEYKRFIYIDAVAEHDVTPSDQVDQVWHAHVLHTRDYAKFCQKVLGGKFFHHNPSTGGFSEDEKHADWYAKTLESYQRIFDEAPSDDIWPSAGTRVHRHFVRINVADGYIGLRLHDNPIIFRIVLFFLKISKITKAKVK